MYVQLAKGLVVPNSISRRPLLTVQLGRGVRLCLILLFLCETRHCHGLAAIQQHHQQSSNVGILIHPVESASDIRNLADLRYNEWIVKDKDDGGTCTTNTVSRHAFRCATAEIHEERVAEGAVAFLARRTVGDNRAVGAAELSPIELQGAIISFRSSSCSSSSSHNDNKHNHKSNRILYVTDVLTAKGHRRKGVARALMQTMEEYALHRVAGTIQHSSSPSAVLLLLHVEPSNHAALKFYRNKLQYDVADSSNLRATVDALVSGDNDCRLDCDRLAENAGAVGQVLLGKLVLSGESAPA